uniref:Uncharacterized protein n=1 Tax=viral metagenome TaxID=1070528 RepID=A0A6H1ZMF1_9ZZZZ
MPYNLSSYIGELNNPNNQAITTLRGNMNTLANSMTQSIGNTAADAGWGGNSGLLGKTTANTVMPAVSQGMGQGLAEIEGQRMQLLLSALSEQERNALQERLFREQMQFNQQQAIWGGIGGGVGNILGGFATGGFGGGG